MIAGTHGVDLRLDSNYDLTGWTAATVVIIDPSGTRSVKTATVADPVTDGIISYVTEAGVFKWPGEYKVQGSVVFGVDKLLKTTAVVIDVEDDL